MIDPTTSRLERTSKPPHRVDAAPTRSWSNARHVLRAATDGDQMTVRAIGEGVTTETSALADIVRYSREGTAFAEPIVIRRDRPW